MSDALVDARLEKPVAGGRCLARVDGRVVLVSGGLPGEQVRIAIERTGKGVAFGRVVTVVEPSDDRVEPIADPRCGGLAFAHVAYARQLALKREIVEDALRRIGRFSDIPVIDVVPSPPTGWRLRARLHVAHGQVGFFREGTHTLCDAGPAAQMVPGLLETARELVARLRPDAANLVEAVTVTQAVDEGPMAAHLDLHRPLPRHGDVWRGGSDDLPVAGVSAAPSTSRHPATLVGQPWIRERLLTLGVDGAAGDAGLQRHAAAFFQGNRALLPALVRHVLEAVTGPEVPLVDLYAGVGLFGIAAAAAHLASPVTCVEGDTVSAEDLVANASRAGEHVQAVRGDVETFVTRDPRGLGGACVVVDPPRTGLAPSVATALTAAHPATVVYVSCDPATLARDLLVLTAGGMRVARMTVFDMFPVTAHVETVVTLHADR